MPTVSSFEGVSFAEDTSVLNMDNGRSIHSCICVVG